MYVDCTSKVLLLRGDSHELNVLVLATLHVFQGTITLNYSCEPTAGKQLLLYIYIVTR